MEAYKSHCPTCGATYFWTGFKTGIGKTPEQLADMHRRHNVCRECGAEGLQTGFDFETETGKAMEEINEHCASMIVDILKEKIQKRGSV